ncbi:MAG: hypothetical protein JST39_06605, partial [Bacteroidetes bacterium]|nr:hypothetical protein [Bacteroidota bacterium]
MIRTTWLLPALFIIAACHHRSPDSVVKDNKVAHTLAAPVTSVTGTWSGMFEAP